MGATGLWCGDLLGISYMMAPSDSMLIEHDQIRLKTPQPGYKAGFNFNPNTFPQKKDSSSWIIQNTIQCRSLLSRTSRPTLYFPTDDSQWKYSLYVRQYSTRIPNLGTLELLKFQYHWRAHKSNTSKMYDLSDSSIWNLKEYIVIRFCQVCPIIKYLRDELV